MRKLSWRCRFDSAYCWGNSFGYFDHDNCQRFLEAIASALKPGGRFILESGAVSESILPVLPPERKLRIGDLDFLSRNTYDAAEGRMDITYTFTRGPAAGGEADPPVGAFGGGDPADALARGPGAARCLRQRGRRSVCSRLATIHRPCAASWTEVTFLARIVCFTRGATWNSVSIP